MTPATRRILGGESRLLLGATARPQPKPDRLTDEALLAGGRRG